METVSSFESASIFVIAPVASERGGSGKVSGALEKSLAILEVLSDHPEGMAVTAIAEAVDQPVSSVHRTLRELARLGYVRQPRDQGDYALTIKLPALGLSYLGRAGVTDIAQPIMNRLAAVSGELVRLSVLDETGLTWVGVAQGATSGLRYDPGREQGVRVHPASTAGGRALMMVMSDDEALALVGRTGLRPEGHPATAKGPASLSDLLELIAEARRRGYSVAVDSYIEGMAAMAVPVCDHDRVLGCLSIAGPAVRLTAARMEELAPELQRAADEVASAASASLFFPHAP